MIQLPNSTAPTLQSVGLSDDERLLIQRLLYTGQPDAPMAALCRQFYRGQQAIKNLRIAVPKELEPYLDAVAGWPAVAVDPLVERLNVDGFRLPNADDTDAELSDLMVDTGLESEFPIAVTDALSTGSAFFTVGSTPQGGAPRVTVSSPLMTWYAADSWRGGAEAVLQRFGEVGEERAVLVLPRLSIHFDLSDGKWTVIGRDQHDFDFVPVTRMANMPLSDQRHGRSEITPSIRSHTVSASRALRALDVAGEIYSIPQKLILGAAEEAFQKKDGTAKSAFETYMTSMLALERDENGDLPDVKQMTPYDPGVFTKVIDMHAARIAGELAAVPQDLGLYTEGNPPSAESVRASEMRRDRKARVRQKFFGPALTQTMGHVLAFQNGGVLPDKYRQMRPDWELDSTTLTADDVSKLGDHIPTGSDVVLKKLGFNAVERRRLADDARRARVASASRAFSERVAGDAGNQ